jgi:2-polyprenyl-3-methyl-5-hydroxy-6-metoxy-1,4-benzoquinol methylase
LVSLDKIELNKNTPISQFARLKLWIKYFLFPGLDIATRKRMKFSRHFLKGDITTLDAGCGNGAFLYKAYMSGNRCLGIGIDPDQIRRCNEYRDFLKLDPLRCQFKVHNIYNIVSLGEKFDQVICFETLEHLKRDQEMLFLFSKVLNPGGILHICTPYLHRKPYYGEVISKAEDGGHLRLGYTYDELGLRLNKAGFKIVRKDSAVGLFSQKIGNIMRWIQTLEFLPVPIRIGCGILLLSLYFLTFFDFVIPYQPLSIYVQAKFIDRQPQIDLIKAD